MKVLVTGPDGVLGSNLVRELISRGHEVMAMSEDGKKSPTIDNLFIKKVGGNLLNADEIIRATEKMDIVIHCAACTAMFPARSELVNKVNIDGTQNIIDACIQNKVKRLIYVGTANSFGSGSEENPGTEKNKYGARKYGLDYMDSKYAAQELVLNAVKEKGLDAVVVNPTFMIGPYDATPSSGTMILKIYNNKVPGYTYGGKNFVAVKDVAVGISNAIAKGQKGECYILGNENLNYKEAFRKIAEVVGVRGPKRKVSTFLARFIGTLNGFGARIFKYKPGITYPIAVLGTEEHYYSSAKARKELELPETPIEFAIKECFDWFKANGYIKK